MTGETSWIRRLQIKPSHTIFAIIFISFFHFEFNFVYVQYQVTYCILLSFAGFILGVGAKSVWVHVKFPDTVLLCRSARQQWLCGAVRCCTRNTSWRWWGPFRCFHVCQQILRDARACYDHFLPARFLAQGTIQPLHLLHWYIIVIALLLQRRRVHGGGKGEGGVTQGQRAAFLWLKAPR